MGRWQTLLALSLTLPSLLAGPVRLLAQPPDRAAPILQRGADGRLEDPPGTILEGPEEGPGMVSRSKPGATVKLAFEKEPTRLALDLQKGEEGSWRVVATLTDGRGRPLANRSVLLWVNTAFGRLSLGSFPTDGQGVASVTVPGRRVGLLKVVGEFRGGGGLAASRGEVALDLGPGRPLEERPGIPILGQLSPQPNLISPSPPLGLLFLLGLVLGGIWATYGYVFYQLSQIKKGR